MSESTNTEARERLEALVGEWAIEAGSPDGPPWPGEGRVTFEWFGGATLLVERLHVEPFSQRFTGTFSEDGRTIGGRWEIAEDGKTWRSDFDVTYTRIE